MRGTLTEFYLFSSPVQPKAKVSCFDEGVIAHTGRFFDIQKASVRMLDDATASGSHTPPQSAQLGGKPRELRSQCNTHPQKCIVSLHLCTILIPCFGMILCADCMWEQTLLRTENQSPRTLVTVCHASVMLHSIWSMELSRIFWALTLWPGLWVQTLKG